MGTHLDDIVDLRRHYDQDLGTRADLVASQYDYGVGRIFTGAVVSTLVAATSAFNSDIAFSYYDAIAANLPIYSELLYNTLFGAIGFGLGIAYGNADTNKQKLGVGLATGALVVYSGSQALTATGASFYYLLTAAAIKSGFTLGIIGSAVAPVAAFFGVGWTLSTLYKRLIKGKRGGKKRGRKKSK